MKNNWQNNFAVKKKAVPLHPLSGNKTPAGI